MNPVTLSYKTNSVNSHNCRPITTFGYNGGRALSLFYTHASPQWHLKTMRNTQSHLSAGCGVGMLQLTSSVALQIYFPALFITSFLHSFKPTPQPQIEHENRGGSIKICQLHLSFHQSIHHDLHKNAEMDSGPGEWWHIIVRDVLLCLSHHWFSSLVHLSVSHCFLFIHQP